MAADPLMPVLIPQPHGGALRAGGSTAPRRGKYLRRETREAATLEFSKRIPKLAQIADGQVKILLGFRDPMEAAERFFELRERMANPDADRVAAWMDAPIAERRLLTEVFAVMIAEGRSHKELALEVGVKEQLAAIDTLGKYGPGTHAALVDDENEEQRGVIALPEMDMVQVQRAQARARAAMSDEEEAEYEIVEEEATDSLRRSEDVAPPPMEERVNPELVEIIKRRRNRNGNGKKEG